MTPEMLASLRDRFENGNGPITMGELDMLINYAEESMKWRSEAKAAIDKALEHLKRIA